MKYFDKNSKKFHLNNASFVFSVSSIKRLQKRLDPVFLAHNIFSSISAGLNNYINNDIICLYIKVGLLDCRKT